MILLLGASGFIGSAFATELHRRQIPFVPLARAQLDYTRFDHLLACLRRQRPTFVINAAGYTGKPNVDACETARADTLLGNSLLPQTVAHACAAAEIPWGHVSSGCIFSGAKIAADSAPSTAATLLPRPATHGRGEGRGEERPPPKPLLTRIEKDFTRPDLRALVDRDPAALHGFTEDDEPNFTFRDPPCSFYSGTKALGEEALATSPHTYIWRLRIPFDEFDNPRNYLTKLQRYARVYDNVNSLSHRADFARAALDLWERRAPFGTYHVTNPGFITTRQVIALLEKILRPARPFAFWESDAEFYQLAAKTPRSNCVLDVSKLLATGVRLRPVTEALEHSLRHWQPAA